uniref:(northern house mosquito) hypothetical protein n=1 Tax=Culex pipiens TaxID=7175 RepID=A0A8D8CBD2_CULPI
MSGSGIQVDTYVSTAGHNKYEFEWVINNFSVWIEIAEGGQISAKFPYNTNGKEQWKLIFFPKSEKDETFCSLFLHMVSPLEIQDKLMVTFDFIFVRYHRRGNPAVRTPLRPPCQLTVERQTSPANRAL